MQGMRLKRSPFRSGELAPGVWLAWPQSAVSTPASSVGGVEPDVAQVAVGATGDQWHRDVDAHELQLIDGGAV